MLRQISIYAENKRGTMRTITSVLREKDINILGSVTNDSAEYGIIRMVVSEPEIAVKALTENDYICKLTDVIGVEVADEVGNLNNNRTQTRYKQVFCSIVQRVIIISVNLVRRWTGCFYLYLNLIWRLARQLRR